eukprot:3856213-Amphidinium_carterae.1
MRPPTCGDFLPLEQESRTSGTTTNGTVDDHRSTRLDLVKVKESKYKNYQPEMELHHTRKDEDTQKQHQPGAFAAQPSILINKLNYPTQPEVCRHALPPRLQTQTSTAAGKCSTSPYLTDRTRYSTACKGESTQASRNAARSRIKLIQTCYEKANAGQELPLQGSRLQRFRGSWLRESSGNSL